MVSEAANGSGGGTWQHFPVRRIEDLRNAVLGAELETMQLSGPPLRGSLAFSASGGIVISTGVIGGTVALRGALARDAVTLLLCLTPGQGSRLWLETIRQGDTVAVPPDYEVDAIFSPPTAYVAVTLTEDRLRKEITRSGLRIDPGTFERGRCRGARVRPAKLEDVTRQVALTHRAAFHEVQPGFGKAVLALLLGQLASAETAAEISGPGWRAEVIGKARDYIHGHISEPIRMSGLVGATEASARTIHRAFREILEDTPQGYVRRARLHAVRRDLLSQGETTGGIGNAAARWGSASDPGRLAARYRALFGEKPSETLAAAREQARGREWM